MINKEADVLIVGGGAAGLAAACKAFKEDAGKIVIIEGAKELGGILLQCVHTGFGLEYFNENLTGPEYMQKFIDKISNYNIETLTQAMVIGIETKSSFDHFVDIVSSENGFMKIYAKTVILTTGCRERGRDELNIPGDRPAGVMTAGTAQRYMDIYGYLPGKEVIVVGSGDIGLIMARRFSQEGAHVKGVYEILSYTCGLRRNQAQCLLDFGIPLYLGSTVVQIKGKKRIESVVVAKVNENLIPILGTEEEVKCDLLVLATGLVPDLRFPRMLPEGVGFEIDLGTGGPVVNEFLETSVPNIFAAGNFLMVNDIVDDVTSQGEIAALSAVRALEGAASKGIQWKHVVLGNGIRSVVPQKFSGIMDVKFYIRIKEPAENAYIEVPEIGVRSFNRVLRPPEMVRLEFSKDLLKCDNLTFQVKVRGNVVKKSNIVKGCEGMATKSIICIVCPIGCQTTVIMDGDKVKEIQGALCSRGLEFIRQEATFPVRILFTVVPIEGASTIGVLPIRSDKPVPKQLLERSLKELSKVNVKAPIKVGDIIVKDLLGQGFNMIASRTVNS